MLKANLKQQVFSDIRKPAKLDSARCEWKGVWKFGIFDQCLPVGLGYVIKCLSPRGSEELRQIVSTRNWSMSKSIYSIFGKIGRNASEEVLFSLIKSKCLPVLLYSTEVCPMNSADRQSLQFTVNKMLFKIFGVMSKDTYSEVSKYFGIEPLEDVIGVRRDKFLKRYCATDSYLICRLINARH